ncbi:hypothetical protein [Mycoplasma zalophi]|uniref:Spermidine/putrescine ABC transporter substrate-binding protein n=1 Tax=Mycoplasma zalophi TaxID=191287 RepID=A0ABS6DNX2_9MOLU|nr:hypothetical protein [Mycoplasma zalophi]MBU4691208.1 hypothetical protein [Mycoplasma zalophi]MBU4692017.1 hypothetical protein [Mycoplasma zalophi]
MLKSKVKKIITLFSGIILGLISVISVAFAITIKLDTGYKPSIYNYGSYLEPSIIKEFKSKYNYKVFNDINEFTTALNNEKAIAGVGSDFQAAQLIIDDKIKKIDFKLLFNIENNILNGLKNIFRKEIIDHLIVYDNYILSLIKINYPQKLLTENTYDVDGDKKEDHFWEYVVPYYSQDKVIAYNVNNKFRPHIKLTEEEKENGIEFKDKSWFGIMKTLKEHGYTNFGWNNAYYDNLMIGAFYENYKNPGTWIDEKTKKLKQFDFTNYTNAIDGFNNFIKDTTTFDIRDTKHNFLIGDGLELLNTLIEPKLNKADAAILYNGDAIDAYYSSDNFSDTDDGDIKFIRPRNNYLLVDVWIQAKSLTTQQSNDFILELKNKLYNELDANESTKKIEQQYELSYLKTLKSLVNESEQELEENSIAKKIYDILNQNKIDKNLDKDIIQEILDLHLENEDAWADEFANAFGEVEYTEIINFDYVNYTPTLKATYNFIKKWYFGTDEVAIQLYDQPDQSEDYNVYIYQIIDTQLRTAISTYNYKSIKS